MVTATDSGVGDAPIGPRVTIALPAELLADIDARAAARGWRGPLRSGGDWPKTTKRPRPNEGPGSAQVSG